MSWEHSRLSPLQVRVKPQQRSGTARKFSTKAEKQVTMAQFVDSLEQTPAPYYAARLLLAESLPDLLEDLEPQPAKLTAAFGKPKGVNPISYLGASNQATQCHFDNAENLVFVVAGTKEFDLFHPSTRMYPKPNGQTKATSLYSRMDYFGFRDSTEFPTADSLQPLKVRLEKGDMLYVPICWWHAVQGGEEWNQIVAYFFDQHEDKVDKDVAAFAVLRGLECKGQKNSHNFPSLWFAWRHLMQCAKEKGVAMCDEDDD
eukprot:TRINITY_DN422_c0_g1_i4.p2 TRINITY_DN422_c0_g1~~TRINITY_DN422_c0_g1_i4.p2  ORF type:complete len:258 (-),score=56.00 TRINITY_DN422_c0_g1_i4:208-981(-)